MSSLAVKENGEARVDLDALLESALEAYSAADGAACAQIERMWREAALDGKGGMGRDEFT